MNNIFVPMLFCGTLFLMACSQEQPVRSTQEFLDNPQFLEAAVVRCSRNRTESRYDAECVNARAAVSVIEAREERARRDQLEAESESKRDALRRRQHAAAEARRHAAEQEQLRKETEYLAQFGVLPTPVVDSETNDLDANVPGAVIPKPVVTDSTSADEYSETPAVIFDEPVRDSDDSVPASDGGNAPVIENHAEPDLDSVRDELRRRQEESAN